MLLDLDESWHSQDFAIKRKSQQHQKCTCRVLKSVLNILYASRASFSAVVKLLIFLIERRPPHQFYPMNAVPQKKINVFQNNISHPSSSDGNVFKRPFR